MSNLFIIGNGFDLAHGIKTTYEDFKNFLLLKNPNLLSISEEELDFYTDISEDSDKIFRLLIEAIDETEGGLWSNLEETLGTLDYNAFLSYNDYKNQEILLENLETRADVFKDLFYSWVHEINMDGVKLKQAFNSLIITGDQFLTFNYTRTLEDIYKVPEDVVFHIHGEAGDPVEFGHGADYRSNSSEEEQMIHEKLRKNTGKIIEDYYYFFEDLPNHQIKKIYSFGFSYSGVDQIYLSEIINNLNDTSGITWLFNSYDAERIEDYKLILEECGFQGNYDTFSV
ncbi:bacteriophage abortive infection AbiH family protein [Gottfriedia sp. NPDC057948]|uniref:bacteriophage abortive infection AbiH family protein n=1 Tax=Gottfriedia sp. NPDC057948 TaxID=3346287 RepID=UPI0036DA564E